MPTKEKEIIDVMTNEKDANVIHNLFAEFHYADDLGVIKSKLAEYVATVRKEEREAALKEGWEGAIAAVKTFGLEQVEQLEAAQTEAALTENRKGEG